MYVDCSTIFDEDCQHLTNIKRFISLEPYAGPDGFVLCVRSYGRPHVPTLSVIERLGLQSATLLFLSHEDKKLAEYGEKLADPWRSRVVFGLKGADKQVRASFYIG